MNEGYREVLSSIGSSEPTPGGGSVAALSLAHAHSLALMVARLTIGKEKWEEGHKAAQSVISKSQVGVEEAIRLAKIDAEAFDSVMSAYRLPRESEGQKEARKSIIRAATIGAASSASELLSSLEIMCTSCNSNALTDLASASELALSAVNMAAMNVRINLDFIKGEDVERLASQINEVVLKSSTSADAIRLNVNERLGW
jgi:formiminotetrahydrofolate cyclodeaminase